MSFEYETKSPYRPWGEDIENSFRKAQQYYDIIRRYRNVTEGYGRRWHPDDIDKILDYGKGLDEEVNKCRRWAKANVEYRKYTPSTKEIVDATHYAVDLCENLIALVNDKELRVKYGPPRAQEGCYCSACAPALLEKVNAIDKQDDFKIKGMYERLNPPKSPKAIKPPYAWTGEEVRAEDVPLMLNFRLQKNKEERKAIGYTSSELKTESSYIPTPDSKSTYSDDHEDQEMKDGDSGVKGDQEMKDVDGGVKDTEDYIQMLHDRNKVAPLAPKRTPQRRQRRTAPSKDQWLRARDGSPTNTRRRRW